MSKQIHGSIEVDTERFEMLLHGKGTRKIRFSVEDGAEGMVNLEKLLSIMIHQVRNHCMSVKGYASLLSYEEDLNDEARKWVGKINKGMAGLEGFLSTFENYRLSKMPSVGAIDPVIVLNDVWNELSSSKGAVELRIDVPGDSRIMGDINDFRKMLRHLLANAIEAIEERGVIEFSFRNLSGTDGAERWMIELRDNGSGMNAEQLANVDRLFYTTKSGHLGCGLNLVFAAASRMRADVEIETAPGHGTVARVVKG